MGVSHPSGLARSWKKRDAAFISFGERLVRKQGFDQFVASQPSPRSNLPVESLWGTSFLLTPSYTKTVPNTLKILDSFVCKRLDLAECLLFVSFAFARYNTNCQTTFQENPP
jgi:hypothetical protein